ncbi:MAG: hypothetical protein KAS66_05310 [Candidatus Omnitrophica bacterium]|nr:hypothetical protein [Candidatus Omnitrophota bacterium]
MTVLELGEFLPDQPDFANPGVTIVKNAISAQQGYRPLKALSSVSDALDSRPLGAAAATSSDADTHIYAGDATKLYELSTTSAWDDVSKAGGYISTSLHWDMAAYGGIMIATNFADNPQKFDMDNDSLFSDLTTDFKAKTCAVVRDFMFFGNTEDSADGHVANRVRWSANGDYTDYTISATTQSDFQDTPGGGSVIRIFGGEYAAIFFERSIYKVSYVGSPVIWQFDEVDKGHGLYAFGAAEQVGETIFYLDSDGFYAFNGQSSTPIGTEKVDNWFFDTLDENYIDRISTAVDPANKLVVWSFPGTSHVDGKPNFLLIFNYAIGRWSYAEVDNDMLFPTLSQGFTVEQLDNIGATLDDIDISLDSRALTGGSMLMGAFDSFKLSSFAGSNLDAIFETNERQPYANQRTLITEAWPIVDGGITTIQIGVRNRLQDSYTWSTAEAVNATGFAPLRSEGRYIRARMNVTGTWTNAQGVETIDSPVGGR